jgi:hypothetical protein
MSWVSVGVAGAQLGVSGYNLYQGVKQKRRGQSILDNLERPTYTTPSGITQSTALAKNQLLDSRLAGQGAAENKLSGSTSQAIDFARGSGRSAADIMAVITGTNANQNKGIVDLGVAADERQLADVLNYQKALNTESEYKDKEFAYNKWMPYMADRQYGESLVGAGATNINSSLNDITSGAATLAGNDDLTAMLTQMRNRRKPNTSGDWYVNPQTRATA